MTVRLARAADWVVRSPRRLWMGAFTVFLVLAASWSIATPMGASPDEYSHIIRAAGVVRGQINGPEVMIAHNVGGIDGRFAETAVDLPAWYQQLTTLHKCYAFDSREPAGCAPALTENSDRIVQTSTASGRYNPAYYMAVGWPSLVVGGPVGLYLMRLVSAMFCAAMLASAVVTAAEWRRRSVVLLGVLAAATPMAVFMAGVVNPSGGEIVSGLLVWTTLLTMLMSPDPRLLTRRLVRLLVGGAVLITIRPLGPLWLAGAVGFALCLQARGALRQVLRRKVTWLAAVLLAAVTWAALWWTQGHPDHSVIRVPTQLTPAVAAQRTFDDSYLYIKQMLGFFGWLDTPAPALVQAILIAVILGLTGVALIVGRTLERLALLAMAVAIVAVPVVAQASQVTKLGMVWQGRYLLPLAVGLPLMAAMTCARRLPERGLQWHRLAGLGAAALALAQLMAFYRVLRRYAVGTDGPLLIMRMHWQPPGSWELWTVVYCIACIGLFTLALAGDRPAPEEGTGQVRSGGSSRLGRRAAVPAG